MELQTLQIAAGGVSSFLFITGSVPMLLKAFRTRNMQSYSLSNMVFANLGNLVYWLYVSSLPLGPIWVLHSFYTVTSVVMLLCYLRYEYPTHRHGSVFDFSHR